MQNNKMGVFFVHTQDSTMGSIVLAGDRNDARKFYSKQYAVKYFETRCMKLFDAEFSPTFDCDAPKFLKQYVSVV